MANSSKFEYGKDGIVLDVRGLTGPASQRLIEMGFVHSNAKSSAGELSMEQVDGPFAIIPDAVRMHYNDGRSASEYELDEQKNFIKRDYSLTLNYEALTADIFFRKESNEVLDLLEMAVRWLVKTIAQGRGMIYLPGILMRRGAVCVLFSGHPELGLQQVLSELVKNGVQCTSHGVLINAKEWHSMPGRRTAKEPFASRLESLFTGEQHVERGVLTKIIFVSRRCGQSSELKILKPEQIADVLSSLSSRAYEFTWPQWNDRDRSMSDTLAAQIPSALLLLGDSNASAELKNIFEG